MAKVEIYTKALCPYCIRAKALFKKKGVDFVDYPAFMDKEKRAEMVKRSEGGRTFPQIFIDDIHIGGCDDLHALERAGKLDPLLGL